MRIVIGFVLFFGLCSAIVGAERFPYVASVGASEVAVRSGPGLEFYETSFLRQGDKVEVYHETGNWLAVRPPLGSFSWVSARYVDLHLGNLGTVTVDGLAARIGSENSDLCETVQVKLKRGEKLLVLDRKETPDNAASPLWYKISPPSGEYRWIPRSAVTSNGSQSISRRGAPTIIPVRYEAENTVSPPVMVIPPPPLRAPKRPDQPPDQSSPGYSSVKRTPITDDLGTPGEIPPLAELLANAHPSRRQELPPSVSEKEWDPFQKAFEELKQEARVALTRPTDDWVFETLIKQGNYLYEISPTDDDLEKLYHLIETLQRTRTVRQEIALRRHSRSGGDSLMAAPRTPAPIMPAGHRAEVTGYDVVGKLGRFDPQPVGYPPYAVVNERNDNEIICLITPAPDVDLSAYLGKNVGINGVFGLYRKRPNDPGERHIEARSVAEIR